MRASERTGTVKAQELINLLQMGKPTVWIHHGANHEEAPFSRVWMEQRSDGLTLRADVRNVAPYGTAIEFRENMQTVWKVAIKSGERRNFSFSQKITVSKPTLAFLAAK
jgi:hypothetical protein